MARNAGWTLLMRIEDLDGPRVKREAAKQALEILAWLGIDYDGEPTYQSSDLEPYRNAMRRLCDQGLAYQTNLTRTQIEQAAGAPHADEHEVVFPASLRSNNADDYRFHAEHTNYRFVVDDQPVTIDDEMHGRVLINPSLDVGDFVVWTKRAAPAYQLAVVVDDARQGVTDVVRGDDLLASAGRQVLLYRALALHPPHWRHLPLVVGPDGRRLAKRHGDTRVAAYRDRGVPSERIVGLLAYWSGVATMREPMSSEEFRRGFVLAAMPKERVMFTQKDHEWLMAGAGA